MTRNNSTMGQDNHLDVRRKVEWEAREQERRNQLRIFENPLFATRAAKAVKDKINTTAGAIQVEAKLQKQLSDYLHFLP